MLLYNKSTDLFLLQFIQMFPKLSVRFSEIHFHICKKKLSSSQISLHIFYFNNSYSFNLLIQAFLTCY